MSERKKALVAFGAVFGGMGLAVAASKDGASSSHSPVVAVVNVAQTQVLDDASAPTADTTSIARIESKDPDASDAQKLLLTQSDPQMRQAAHAVGALINLNGHLCSQVFHVEPAAGGEFLVDCVKHKGRNIKVRYQVNGSTASVTQI